MRSFRKFIKSIIPSPQYRDALWQLKNLAASDQLNQSTTDDLRDWENNLKILRNTHPFWEIKLLENNLIDAFPAYLKKHYPLDERLSKLQILQEKRKLEERSTPPTFYD